MRVVRVYHAGRDRAHRARDCALVAAGVDVTLVVPSAWEDEQVLSDEPFPIVELDVRRAGDVNRHVYRTAVGEILAGLAPDVLDIHEEPVSLAARQWLSAAPAELPVVMYTAQNIDKRYPPPFHRYETNAYRRVAAFYPCSRQAAAVIRGKGFAGLVEVLPLGYDDSVFRCGSQTLDSEEIVLAFAGRLVPEKGVLDAVRVLAAVHAERPARLVVVGEGPEEHGARRLAASLGIADRLELRGWQSAADVAALFRSAHVVLVPSHSTSRWVEQFGRVIVEARASGALVGGYATGTIPEVGGDAAVLVPEGDATALAGAIVRVLADPHEFSRRRQLAAGSTWREIAQRQADLYVRAREAARRVTPPPARGQRAAAHAEFGPTAATPAGYRPFALPVLRRLRSRMLS